MERMDVYDIRPRGMDAYLSHYGWHFSKPMAEFASKRFGTGTLHTSELYQSVCSRHSNISNSKGYDAHYLLSKFRKTYPNFSDMQIENIVDSYLANEYDTAAFTRFYADCQANQIPINWEDLI